MNDQLTIPRESNYWKFWQLNDNLIQAEKLEVQSVQHKLGWWPQDEWFCVLIGKIFLTVLFSRVFCKSITSIILARPDALLQHMQKNIQQSKEII